MGKAVIRRFWFLLFAVTGVHAQQHLTSGGKLKPEQAIMDIRHYTIALKVDIAGRSIDGYTDVDMILSQTTPVLLLDLLDSFQVRSVAVDGFPAPFVYAANLIRITPAALVRPGRHTVRVVYGGKPHVAVHPPWDDGFTWTKDSSGNPWVAITAEGTGGKLYFPCKDHPSDEPDEGVDMYITVPDSLVVAGPGLLQSSKGGTYHWKTNYTINNYSIVFNVGQYRVVQKDYTTVAGHHVPMVFYVLEEHAAKAPHHLEVLERIVHEQEKYFGEYPWVKEKIGIVETPHLGMEHQTMNAYGNHFRYTKVGGEDYDDLMHHEFGHEWWGNRVTAKDWADYWIHEGINTYGDGLYVLDKEGEKAYDQFFRRMAAGISNQAPIVLGKDIDEEAAYQGDIYPKGAFFMHTLRWVLGDSTFFPILKSLASADTLVDSDDVEAYFSSRVGADLKPLFDLYLRTTNKLDIRVRALGGGRYGIHLENMRPTFTIPLEVVTDKGTIVLPLQPDEVTFSSATKPGVDPRMCYLATVTFQ
ncbi:M1 family metallopeptidase [Dinghuibacter silviterrae]|uniref:Aminopeptidase N n=1 Tax=Dinghuibacter silviterrae TaxID=1539049 RepID=A0A4R8DQD1_9BACT|nr:M1 family metallopeptidase [Dinghuibacter silviterrae]TDX00350.1 peptidase M1-like protein [Dinghuibacter silviterrae]